MSKQRYINTKIWEDNWFSNLDQIEQLVFIYLLTNPMTNILGAYELSKATIGRATGLESRMLDEILKRFERDEKVFYVEGWVIIHNFIKNQNYNSPKIKKGIMSEYENVPENVRKFINIGYIYGIDTISHINSNSNLNLSVDTISLNEILKYGKDKNYPEEICKRFYNHYSKNNWKTKNGIKINDWKSKLDYWVNNDFNYSLNNNEDEYTENKWAN